MNMTQGEYLELKLTLGCLERGGLCSGSVSETEGKPYIFLSIASGPDLPDEKSTMESLMDCYRECRRFPWANEVLLEKAAPMAHTR